jgi:hypothetical protein
MLQIRSFGKQRDKNLYISPAIIYQIQQRGIWMAEPVMVPVTTILTGALLIAADLIFAPQLAPWIGIILAIGGVATILVGMIMLFGLAHGKK